MSLLWSGRPQWLHPPCSRYRGPALGQLSPVSLSETMYNRKVGTNNMVTESKGLDVLIDVALRLRVGPGSSPDNTWTARRGRVPFPRT